MFGMIMQMLLNSYIVYKFTTDKNLSFLDFIKQIICNWVTQVIESNLYMYQDESIVHLTGRHFLQFLDQMRAMQTIIHQKYAEIVTQRAFA